MQATIEPGTITGVVRIPPSKSMMQRVCAAALLHSGNTSIYNPGISDDDKAAIRIIDELGARIAKDESAILSISSTGKIEAKNSQIYSGESGLSTRLFIPIAALASSEIIINGCGSLLARPMTPILDVLPLLGVSIESNTGRLPIKIKGPLMPKPITIDGSMSSQFLSGLLFAFSNSVIEPVNISVTDLQSKPYVDLTIEVLKHFGSEIKHEHYQSFTIYPKQEVAHKEVSISINGDWSSAAYWLVAAAISGNVELEGLSTGLYQADEHVLSALRAANCLVNIHNGKFAVHASSLEAFSIDLTDSPDLFPILSILASCCRGTSSLRGISRLVHKESNRSESIQAMLGSFGVKHSILGNDLIIEGVERLKANTIQGYHDHRIVMAATIGVLKADGPVVITDAESVSKSYPQFFQHASSLGIKYQLSQQ